MELVGDGVRCSLSLALLTVVCLLGALPFRLTGAQERVWDEIRRDMAAPWPMHRLTTYVTAGPGMTRRTAAPVTNNNREEWLISIRAFLVSSREKSTGSF